VSERTKGTGGVGFRGGTEFRVGRVRRAMKVRVYDAVGGAGAYILKAMRRSVKTSAIRKPKPGGKITKTYARWAGGTGPLRSPTGLFKRSLGFSVNPDRSSVIVGPEFVGNPRLWGVHEYGGTIHRGGVYQGKPYSKRTYPSRPTARLALEKSRPGIAKFFREKSTSTAA